LLLLIIIVDMARESKERVYEMFIL